MACRISELVLNCRDPSRLAAFWCEVLGYAEFTRDADSIEIGRRSARGRGMARARRS
jgi:catechol-2,3-dioxygenase